MQYLTSYHKSHAYYQCRCKYIAIVVMYCFLYVYNIMYQLLCHHGEAPIVNVYLLNNTWHHDHIIHM